jgi:hypothetical protein
MLPESAWRQVILTNDLTISLANENDYLPIILILLVVSCGPIHKEKRQLALLDSTKRSYKKRNHTAHHRTLPRIQVRCVLTSIM